MALVVVIYRVRLGALVEGCAGLTLKNCWHQYYHKHLRSANGLSSAMNDTPIHSSKSQLASTKTRIIDRLS